MSNGSLVPQVDRLFREGTVAGVPDGGLLERFADGGDHRAFEALVALHGPLVLGVCRRLLHDPRDVEDAFQATFLVLVRRARAIRRRELLGPWLYGVAYRVATRARIVRARRREQALGSLEPAASVVDPAWGDLRPVLDAELGRLPEKYRLPLVLCYFQGLTHHETAIRLGCPVGTVRSRLARGRERLAKRLVRRGLAPAVGLLAGALRIEAAADPVPASLAASTSDAAARIAAGYAVSSTVSAASAALIRGALRSMIWNPWRKGAVVTTVFGAILAGTVFSAKQATGDPPGRPGSQTVPGARSSHSASAARREKTVQRPVLQPLARYVVQPPDMLIVEVLEALPGRPISGERLVRPDGTITLGFYGDVYVAGLEAAEIKEKVVLHLRKFLSDETLGLTMPHPKNPAQRMAVAPKDSDRVFVDIAAYNSAFYYVVGDVPTGGRFPITGSDTVLDAINHAGGPIPDTAPPQVRIIRRGPAGKPDDLIPVDYDEITMGTDPSTNYQLMPGDRVVVTHRPKAKPDRAEGAQADAESGELRRLERRLDRLEEKMDRVLDALQRTPDARPRPAPTRRDKD